MPNIFINVIQAKSMNYNYFKLLVNYNRMQRETKQKSIEKGFLVSFFILYVLNSEIPFSNNFIDIH